MFNRLLCWLFGHREGPRGEAHEADVVLRAHGIDGVVRERTAPARTYTIVCLRCGETIRGEVVLLNNVVVDRF